MSEHSSSFIEVQAVRFEMVPHWVLDHADITPNALRLYLQLRRYAGKEQTAFPSRKTLARDLRVSVPTIDTAKNVLIAIGAITVTARHNGNGQTSNLYKIIWEGGSQKTCMGVAKKDVPPQPKNMGTNLDSFNLDPMNLDKNNASEEIKPLRVIEPSGMEVVPNYTVIALQEPSRSLFDDFWSVYPRRAAKAAARKAFDKAIKSEKAEVIIIGAASYRDDPNREDAFTAHAATWLNAERWSDDPLPGRTRQQTGGDKRTDHYQALYNALDGRREIGQ